MNIFEKKNAEQVTEFDRFIREHPEFSDKIPNGALVVMLVEGDEQFNKWNIEGAKKQIEKGQPIVYVKVKRLEPIRSRIKDIELAKAVQMVYRCLEVEVLELGYCAQILSCLRNQTFSLLQVFGSYFSPSTHLLFVFMSRVKI